jgi:hypothetical protein
MRNIYRKRVSVRDEKIKQDKQDLAVVVAATFDSEEDDATKSLPLLSHSPNMFVAEFHIAKQMLM